MIFPKRSRRFTIYEFEEDNYRVDRYLFQGLFIFLVVLFFVAWAIDGFGDPRFMNFKLQCRAKTYGCDNPFYGLYQYKSFVPLNVLELKVLPPGFYYGKFNPLADNYVLIMAALIVILLFLNHFLYNKGFPFKKYLNKSLEDYGKNG